MPSISITPPKSSASCTPAISAAKATHASNSQATCPTSPSRAICGRHQRLIARKVGTIVGNIIAAIMIAHIANSGPNSAIGIFISIRGSIAAIARPISPGRPISRGPCHRHHIHHPPSSRMIVKKPSQRRRSDHMGMATSHMRFCCLFNVRHLNV